MRKELQNISSLLKTNKREIVIFTCATLFLTLANYHPVWNYWFSSLLYYAILPVGVVLSLRRNPLDFGLRIGQIKVWGLYVIIICLLITPILFAASHLTAFQTYYTREDFDLVRYGIETCVYLLGWEYIFRGFLLFGLKEKLKEVSILVQMVPFVLLHLGKPELETYSTIITGMIFGYVAYRGKSFWPAYFIHLFINIFFLVIVNLM